MRLADRVKSWLRKLGPSEDAAASTAATRLSSGGQDAAPTSQEGSGVPRSLPQPQPTGDSSQPAPPAPAPPPPAPVVQQEPVTASAPPQPQQQPPQQAPANGTNGKSMLDTRDFFAEAVHAEANRYTIKEVIGKGSYGVVCSAVDNFTGEKVAIKKITNVFEHVSDATRIVREIKLLRLLKHPDIVDIKHIMLPPSPKDFKDIYVVFELLETDLHQVIKANDDLTPEHHQFFLYQMLRGLKYIHSAKVFHRDLKPKNILANSDCKLKICDFGLARPAFNDMPTTVFWTDYVATRWYRAPELCGSFFAKYSPAIDIWSVGCIFAEVLLGKPLFPGRNVVHQLELITDLLGTPSAEVIAKVRNEKARRFLLNMRPKPGVPFEQHFPRADRAALRLLRRLLAFDPAERPTAEEALADPYFTGLHCVAREPVAQPLSKMAFEFDRRKLTLEDVRELIYREILEYHPQMLKDYLAGASRPNFHYPSALESFKRQFAHLEAGGAPLARGQQGPRIYPSSSLPKEWVAEFQAEAAKYINNSTSGNPAPSSRGAAVAAPPASSSAGGATSSFSSGGAAEVPSAVAPPPSVSAAPPPQRPGVAASGSGRLVAPDAGSGSTAAAGTHPFGSDVPVGAGQVDMDGVYDMVISPVDEGGGGGGGGAAWGELRRHHTAPPAAAPPPQRSKAGYLPQQPQHQHQPLAHPPGQPHPQQHPQQVLYPSSQHPQALGGMAPGAEAAGWLNGGQVPGAAVIAPAAEAAAAAAQSLPYGGSASSSHLAPPHQQHLQQHLGSSLHAGGQARAATGVQSSQQQRAGGGGGGIAAP